LRQYRDTRYYIKETGEVFALWKETYRTVSTKEGRIYINKKAIRLNDIMQEVYGTKLPRKVVKLSDDDVMLIRTSELSAKDLAEKFGVSTGYIYKIRRLDSRN
jgi:hypothetical protein